MLSISPNRVGRPRASTRTVDRTSRRLLVADPCSDTVESTALLLRVWGHVAIGVRNGREALDVVRDFRPDTILTEVWLPGLDGFELAKSLKRFGWRSERIVLAVTGRNDEASRRRVREAGFDGHFVKPVKPEVLQELLRTSRARHLHWLPPWEP